MIPLTSVVLITSFGSLLFVNINRLNFAKQKIHILYGSILGYHSGGLGSGILHWFLDSFNFEILSDFHKNFRTHHNNPMSLEKFPAIEPFVEIIPVFLPILGITLLFRHPLIIAHNIVGCCIGNLSQIIHKLSHRRQHEKDTDLFGNYIWPKVPEFIKELQDIRILLHPDEHSIHHKTELKNYCIAHSHTDKLFEFIFIELFGLRSALYTNSNKIYTPLSKNERHKYVGETTILDALDEQKYLLLTTAIYIFSTVGRKRVPHNFNLIKNKMVKLFK